MKPELIEQLARAARELAYKFHSDKTLAGGYPPDVADFRKVFEQLLKGEDAYDQA